LIADIRLENASQAAALASATVHSARTSKLYWVTAGAIVLLAAWLRFWRLDLLEFIIDELSVTQLVLALVQHGQWPAHGIPSSLGTNNSPMIVYLIAPAAFLWPTPVGLTAFVALLNVVTVGGSIWFARRYFGDGVSLFAGLAMATGPWAVEYSRKIWEQDLLPPFILLFFVGLYAVVVDRKPRYLLVCGVALSIALQLHPSALAIVAIGAAVLIWRPRRFPFGYLVGALMLAVLVCLPYLVAEYQGGFQDWLVALHHHDEHQLGRFAAIIIGWVFWAQVASGWELLGQFEYGSMAHNVPAWVDFGTLVACIAAIGGMAVLVAAVRQRLPAGNAEKTTLVRDERFVLLFLWMVIPPFALGASGLYVFPHYFIILYPGIFIVMGLFAQQLWQSGPIRRWIALCGSAALMVANVGTFLWNLHLAATVPPQGVYGLPWRYLAQTADAIASDAPGATIALGVDNHIVSEFPVLRQLLAWRGVNVEPELGQPSVDGHYFVGIPSTPPPDAAVLRGSVGPDNGQPVVRIWYARGGT
jgi:hypothetical protein